MADIIRAVDEPIDATQCGGKENCHDEHRCLTHDLWMGLNAHIYDYLDNVTLATLVAPEQDECKDKSHAGSSRIQDARLQLDSEIKKLRLTK